MNAIIAIAIISICSIAAIAVNRMDRRSKNRRLSVRPPLSNNEFGKLFPEKQASIAIKLRDILSKWTDVDLLRMIPSDEPCKDLSLGRTDGMDVNDYLKEIEREYRIALPESKMIKTRSFKDLVECVAVEVEKGNRGEQAG